MPSKGWLLLLVACGGSPAPAPAGRVSATVASTVADDRGAEITADHARRIAAAAVEWRRAHGGACPTAKSVTEAYVFPPGIDSDVNHIPFTIDCSDAEIRILAAGTVAHAEPYSERPASVEQHVETTPGVQNAEKVVAALRPRFRACYNKGLASDRNLQGEIHGTLIVGANGVVKDVQVDPKRTTLHDAPLALCIVKVMKDTPMDATGSERRVPF